jgi:hypothetical protein
MAATASSVTVGTTDTTLFDQAEDGGLLTVFGIFNISALDVSVHVSPIHSAGHYDLVPAGNGMEWSSGISSISSVVAKVASGTAIVYPHHSRRL